MQCNTTRTYSQIPQVLLLSAAILLTQLPVPVRHKPSTRTRHVRDLLLQCRQGEKVRAANDLLLVNVWVSVLVAAGSGDGIVFAMAKRVWGAVVPAPRSHAKATSLRRRRRVNPTTSATKSALESEWSSQFARRVWLRRRALLGRG
jgi:hypothetical protein